MAADPQQCDLFIDGYIAKMFEPVDSPGYYASLLKREDIQWHSGDATGAFLAAPPPGLEFGQQHWVIDYPLKDRGPVIRQKIWTPKKSSDKVRRVDHEQLHPPIFFILKNNRGLGLPLIEAAGGDCMCLLRAEEVAPVGTSAHAQIRINWSGYAHLNWNEQISIQKQTSERETVSLETFVKHVGKKVLKFMETAKNETNDGDQKQLIGDHQGHITPRDILLIGTVQVSQGSWMPILQLNNEQWYAEQLIRTE